MALQAAAARAAAYFQLVALSCLATSSSSKRLITLSKVRGWQAAAAPAAAFFEWYSCKFFLGHMFESCWLFAGMLLLGLWKFTGLNSSTIGMGEDTKKAEELKGFRDFSILQASIQGGKDCECRFRVR